MDRMSKPEYQLRHNAIIYRYGCGAVDYIVADKMDFLESGWERSIDNAPSPREKGKVSEGADMERSMRRARAKVRRLALANDFEWFVTLTLDPEKIDRNDGKAVAQALSRWADNMVRRKGLRYILVPELHKKGGIHFHGFMSANDLTAEPSGHYDRNGHPIFNLPQWGLGFSTAIRLYGDYPQAVGYVSKYIGKQEFRPMGRWYYSGGNLQQPEKIYADLDWSILSEEYCGKAVEIEVPGRKLLVIHDNGGNT